MIKNLPNDFPLESFQKFSFGGPEGKDDPLLSTCPLIIRPIIEFLDENKSIVVGERGTGKTAIFRLLSEDRLKFRNDNKRTQIYIPIDEELAYRTLQEHVLNQIKDLTGKKSTAYRIVWELLFVSRCLDRLEKKYKNDEDLKSIKAKFYHVVGWQLDEKIGFLDVLTKTKKTFGIKLEHGFTGYILPNMYASIEPSKDADNNQSSNLLTLDLVELKSELNSFLKKKKVIVYILLDKLDEFVAGEEYVAQRDILQALIQCWRDYQSFSTIKLKLFLRKDLYERIDFSSIGRDKIDYRKVELKWTDEDIRQFIALRIHHNLSHISNKKISFWLDERKLTIDKELLKELRSLESLSNCELTFANKLKKLKISFLNYIKNRKKDDYDARTINIKDIIFQDIITLFFPRKVLHKLRAGKNEQIDIFDYLNTHFQLGSGSTTPRIILIYLEKCLEQARNYYRKNPDKKVMLNDKGEYPLFLREFLFDAYMELRKSCLDTMVSLNTDWEKPARILMQHKFQSKDCTEITYMDAKKTIGKYLGSGQEIDNNLIKFFAFYEHAGLLKCKNKNTPADKRQYSIPILFQKVPC